jgi:hypothetical protein
MAISYKGQNVESAGQSYDTLYQTASLISSSLIFTTLGGATSSINLSSLSGSFTGSIVGTSSYALTSSHSTTLGASLANNGSGQLTLQNSNSSTISTISKLTASLALTASYLTNNGYGGATMLSASNVTDDATVVISLDCIYSRSGDTVVVTQPLEISMAPDSSSTTFNLSLPIPTTFSNTRQAYAVCNSSNEAELSTFTATSDTVTNNIAVSITSVNNGASFTYFVIMAHYQVLTAS